MLNLVRGGLVAVAVVVAFPALSNAQLLGRHAHDRCCQKCRLPVPKCCCTAPAPAPQVTYQPVVETQYAQQPVITQRDVVETQYRSEPVTETIPSVAYDNVCVDEGGYQSVWVPKLVNKQVARTVYQQRTTYRSVPYQVTRRVAECTTQTVPYQTVRYVPTVGNGMAWSGAPTTIGAAPYPGTVASSSYPYSPQPATTPRLSAAPAYSPTPIAAAPSSGGLSPVPDPRFSLGAPTTIIPRSASRDEAYESSKIVPEPAPDVRHAGNGSLFVPAPSAASVWRTPRGTVTR